MSYLGQAMLSIDENFLARCGSCAAGEIPVMYDPKSWTETYIWRLAAAPGFADAYTYALESENPSPGSDPAVISDAQILAAVQELYAALNPEPVPQEGP